MPSLFWITSEPTPASGKFLMFSMLNPYGDRGRFRIIPLANRPEKLVNEMIATCRYCRFSMNSLDTLSSKWPHNACACSIPLE